MKLLHMGVFLCLLLPAICVAQSKKIPVTVNHEGEDSIGQAVAFALKEAIRDHKDLCLSKPMPRRQE